LTLVEQADRYDPLLALTAQGQLRAFNDAGFLTTSDVHVARQLARLARSEDDVVLLGAAFAARAPRLGHVCVDLSTVSATASSETADARLVDELVWPEAGEWVSAMAASALVGTDRPLHLDGANLYLDRLWTDERRVAADLIERSAAPAPPVDDELLAAGLAELFSGRENPDLQRLAAATAVLRRFSVVAGGPGTGKTTTVARILALLEAQASAAGAHPPLVAMAAPTGKAAARLTEAVQAGVTTMAIDPEVRDRLLRLQGTTLHRLLGFNPGNPTRFRHDGHNRLPHEVVVVDETSMVSLSLMARLLDAVRPEARLILVGDPEQLASVEAGAVLGDIVGPASSGLRLHEGPKAKLAAVSGQAVTATAPPGESAIGDGIVVLRHVYRAEGAIAELARAIQEGQADTVMSVLERQSDDVQWLAEDAAASANGPPLLRAQAVMTGRAVVESARAGDARGAIAALGGFRLLCAHRRGPDGVATWMHRVESWLHAEVDGFSTGSEWYVGRPLIVTENDYALHLFNGDTGVVIAAPDGRLVAAFERGEAEVQVSPARLAAVDTVYAMTVHKSQGSEAAVVAVIVPDEGSRLLTRELLYTAVTRARERLIVIGTEASVRAAVDRPIARASGLRQALWGDDAAATRP
jgi:exodeoxyribonuclease V alpha subunit